MTKTTAFLVAASLAAALAATTASAQGLVTHSPPSESAKQGAAMDPNYRKTDSALVPAVKPANAGGTIEPKHRRSRGYGEPCPTDKCGD